MKRTLLLSLFAALAFAPFVLAQNRPGSLKTFGGGSTIDAAGTKIPAGWPLYVTAGTTAGMNGGSTVRDQARTTLSKLQQNISTAGAAAEIRTHHVVGLSRRMAADSGLRHILLG